MSAKHARKLALLLYGKRYKRVACEVPNTCFYCGGRATDMDHCPSIGVSEMLGKEWRSIKHYLIPSCGSCNRWLSDRKLLTPCARALFLANKLENDFQKKGAVWDADEIAEMGSSFQSSLKAWNKIQRENIRRIHHLQVMALRGDDLAERFVVDQEGANA